MLKVLATFGILVGLLTLAASFLVFGMLMLGFSTDGIHNSDRLPEGLLAFFAIAAVGFLSYGAIMPAVNFWFDRSWGTIFWPAKVGFGCALVAMLIDFVIIIKAASG